MTDRPPRRRHDTAPTVALLALLAYVPALFSSPGRMPADTKLYLYLDPGGLVARAPSTFEPDQFAGWVPHQQITYLWPSGPWYRAFDLAGVPDWIAHRLWIGSIMFLAGAGVCWMVRQLGLRGGAALTAALLYQLSPFLLPYISRTSLLLLPWAGLGWIVGLTIRASARAADGVPPGGWRGRLLPWREPALIALVVATVGSANAAALAFIAPGPVLWLAHAAWARIVTWRAVVAIGLRIGGACLVVSLWWVAMLLVQARHGAPVLAYSETLADVSRNSTGSEVLRGLGYWLFYIRDPFAPTTTAASDYLVSTWLIAVSYAVTLVGLAGLALTSSAFRRFGGLLVATGTVLAVGVHPFGSSSPLMSLIADDDGSGIALALRSSTRAIPLLVLGLALGAGSLIAALPRLPRLTTAVTGAVLLLIVLDLPSLWRFELVDPAIDRDQSPPAAWIDAAEALDGGDGARVLQLPGAEFGAFRWGYTVDQPLVGLADRPLVTRDLLPLGSAGAMDLLYALDDRLQEGTAEPASVSPIARLLGADTIWVANDTEFERFRTPRPEIAGDLLTGPEVGARVRTFGAPFVSEPTVPMVDPTSLSDPRVGTPVAPVVLVEVADSPGVVRAKTDPVFVAGSGDGLVDAAAAGLLSGNELIRYAASDRVDPAAALIVTDSNRDRAHHWRGSQDVHGHTEPGGPGDDVLVYTSADQRLAVFTTVDPATQTISVQDGPVSAIASSYGEPFAYLPEHRAVMAIDGDPSTAWLVGGHGDPVGERLRLVVTGTTSPDGTMTLRQPAPPPGGRRISAARITRNDGASEEIVLTDASITPGGQRLPLGIAGPGVVEIEVTGVTTGDPASAASRAAVGFSEIDLGLGPTVEMIRPPSAALDSAAGPLAIVLTRLRVDPLDRWRADPEPALARVFVVPDERAFDAAVTLRLDRRATDEVLTELLGDAAATADRRLTGAARNRGAAALDGDAGTAWITPIDGAIGSSLTFEATEAVGPVIELTQPAGDFASITSVRVSAGGDVADIAVAASDGQGVSSIELPAPLPAGTVTLTITGTDGASTIDRRFGDRVGLPAAIAELSGPGLPSTPPPADSTPVVRECTPGLLEVDGTPAPLSFTTTVGDLLDGEAVPATVCGGALSFGSGEHRIVSTGRAATGLTVDRVVLSDGTVGPAGSSTVTVTVDRDEPRHRVVTVDGCSDGCWLVDGVGFNRAWSADIDGASLGDPVQVDGGFNGWWIPPHDGPVTVAVRWTAQTPVTGGLLLSGLGFAACLAVVALTRGRRPVLAIAAPSLHVRPPSDPRRAAAVSAIALVTASTLLIGPVWGAIALIPAIGLVLLVRYTAWRWSHRLLALAGLGAATLVALGTIAVVRRNRPFPNAAWTEAVERFNGLAVFAVLCIAVGTIGWSGSRREESPT